MAALTERDRIHILMMRGWGDNQRSFEDVRSLFNETFRIGQVPISKMTVSRTVRRFNEHGTIKDLPRSGRPVSVATEENQLDVALSITEDPHSSIRKLQQQHDITYGSVQRILTKNLKFHPYKVKLVHEMNEDDPDRRLEFSEIMMARMNADENFLKNIAFSDESNFFLNGSVNKHNMSYWSEENPHWMMDTRATQYPQKVNVWAGFLDDKIIGPFFYEGNLGGIQYEDMLRNEIVPAIQAIVGENFNQTWFQQDGAAAHYARNVRNYLNVVFPGRWIGRRGSIEWPARSPDLTPLDYFLWGYLKDRVYRTKPQNIAELQQRIRDEMNSIQPEMIKRATSTFYNRMAYCQEVNGNQFEHML